MRESAQAEATDSSAEQGLRASDGTDYDRPVRRGLSPIGSLTKPARAVVQGRVHAVEIRPVEHSTVLACDVADSTGGLTALFDGRSNIPGLRPGSKDRLRPGRDQGRRAGHVRPGLRAAGPRGRLGGKPKRGRGRRALTTRTPNGPGQLTATVTSGAQAIGE